ncbi:hypothetical protein, partial [Chryseobacterium sp. SIMBA_029]|uniref:hypothetical protein n=1 Tax=Chryseobacterium sp. SIMBA_029 TaxID=3085772 RepID=UPI0039798069
LLTLAITRWVARRTRSGHVQLNVRKFPDLEMTPSTASAQYCGQSSLSVVGHPCRIIGFAPNQALFATPPHVDGRILPLVTGENVEMVAIASQA